ncbi:4'-phosphopantetheinyl transferase family protein [Nibrella saemangeumensis]
MQRLPHDVRESIESYIHEKDRKSRLLGKLLLQEGLQILQVSPSWMYQIKKTVLNRPVISAPIDFNISHSGRLVVCVVSNECKVGIDVEQYQKLNLLPYRSCCTHSEWTALTLSPDPWKSFIELWTIKESVSKAEGLGLQMPFNRIRVENGIVVSDKNNKWYTKKILLDTAYACTLAHHVPQINLKISKSQFQQ